MRLFSGLWGYFLDYDGYCLNYEAIFWTMKLLGPTTLFQLLIYSWYFVSHTHIGDYPTWFCTYKTFLRACALWYTCSTKSKKEKCIVRVHQYATWGTYSFCAESYTDGLLNNCVRRGDRRAYRDEMYGVLRWRDRERGIQKKKLTGRHWFNKEILADAGMNYQPLRIICHDSVATISRGFYKSTSLMQNFARERGRLGDPTPIASGGHAVLS